METAIDGHLMIHRIMDHDVAQIEAWDNSQQKIVRISVSLSTFAAALFGLCVPCRMKLY